MIAWGIDFNVYDQWRGKLAGLAANGMTFAVFKTTMGFGDADAADIADFHTEATAANVIPCEYGWIDPTANSIDEVNRYSKLIAQYNPRLVGADWEQWWSDWTKWGLMNEGKLSDILVPRISQVANSLAAQNYCQGLAALHDDAMLLIYTNVGFVGSWAPNAITWLKNYKLWDAGSNYYGTPMHFTDWSVFNGWVASRLVQQPSIKVMTVRMRQISSQVWLPGMTGQYNNVDFDMWVMPDGSWGTAEQMRAELMPAVVVPPVVTPPSVGDLTIGQKVDVLWKDYQTRSHA